VIRAAGIVAAFLALLGASSARALTLQPVGSFDQPTYVASDPGDAGRLLVVERKGTIQLVEGGAVKEFADLSPAVACCLGEQGLLSIALDPGFETTGRLFAVYTGKEEPGEIHLDELVAAGPGHESATFARNLLTIPHPGKTTHNGGQLQFGPDGFLYLSTGDGGGKDDELHNAQDPTEPLGKVLRIDPDSTGEYEIWSLGLRNPYRFSFDALGGDMAIADVGQGLREEVDLAPSPFPGAVGGKGANYGWNCREGFLPGPTGPGVPDPECSLQPPGSFVDPVFDYPHSPDPDSGGSRCAITGGYVARDPSLGSLYGRYVYADYCAGTLRSLQLPASAGGLASGDSSLGLQVDHPVSFGEDAARRLYVVEESGAVYCLAGLVPATCLARQPSPPPAAARPSPTFIGITAQRRRVERGKTAVLTVWVSPCRQRRGETVALLRNGRRNGSRFLSRACTARFLRRVHRNTAFAARTYANGDYLAGGSRTLRIRIEQRRRAARRR
jgi:hypothetical protein